MGVEESSTNQSNPSSDNNKSLTVDNNRYENWVETKVEFEVAKDGTKTPTKSTWEPKGYRYKSWVDLTIRTITLILFLTPLGVYLLNQNNDLAKRKRNDRIDLYGKVLKTLKTLTHKPINSDTFLAAKDELEFEILTKLSFMKDSLVILKIDTLAELVDYCSKMYSNADFCQLNCPNISSDYDNVSLSKDRQRDSFIRNVSSLWLSSFNRDTSLLLNRNRSQFREMLLDIEAQKMIIDKRIVEGYLQRQKVSELCLNSYRMKWHAENGQIDAQQLYADIAHYIKWYVNND